MAMKPRRKEPGYLGKVEAELFAIYRQGKDMSAPSADVTPTDMHIVMTGALRALKALGWEPNPLEVKAIKSAERALFSP